MTKRKKRFLSEKIVRCTDKENRENKVLVRNVVMDTFISPSTQSLELTTSEDVLAIEKGLFTESY